MPHSEKMECVQMVYPEAMDYYEDFPYIYWNAKSIYGGDLHRLSSASVAQLQEAYDSDADRRITASQAMQVISRAREEIIMAADTDAQLSVTIKYKGTDGKGYDQPWAVFHGDMPSIRQNIIDFFALTEDEHKGLPLHAVVLNASRYAHGTQSFAGTLGGTVTAVQTGASANTGSAWDHGAQNAPQEATGASETPAQSAPAQHPHADLIAALEAAQDVDTVKRLWAENRSAFEGAGSEEVIEAYKARGKALSA